MKGAAVLFFACTTSAFLFCQTPDSLRSAALLSAKRSYLQAIKGQSLTQHGIEMASPPKGTEGTPYLWEEFRSGRMIYDGQEYENISLQYDALNEWVLTEHPYGFFPMQLVQNRVSAFEVEGQRFRWLAFPGAAPGFYEQVHAGRVKLWVRRKKEFRERFVDNKAEKIFNSIDQFFIEKDAVLYRINSRKQLWAILASEKAAIKKRWKSLGLDFNRQQEQALVEAASIYE